MSSVSESPGIVVGRLGQATLIELARPAKRNALRPVEWSALSNALVAVGQDVETRAVILTGQGGAFSAGFDLNSAPGRDGPPTLPAVHRAILEVARCPKATVAAVEGACVGAAWALALACDFVIAGEGAFFQPPYASRGLMPDAGIAWFLAERVGRREAARLLFLDGRYTASEAAARDLVSEVVATGTALDRAGTLAAQLAALPPTTVAVAKAALRRSNAPSLESALEGEDFEVSLNSSDPRTSETRDRFMFRLAQGGAADARSEA